MLPIIIRLFPVTYFLIAGNLKVILAIFSGLILCFQLSQLMLMGTFFAFIVGNLNITLAIYSGRPDPEWQVLTSDPNYAEIKRLLDVARSGGLIKGHKDMPSRLCYKGFLVYDTRKKNAVPELIIGPDTVQLQQLLLKTIPEEVLSKDTCTKISGWITSAAVTAGGK